MPKLKPYPKYKPTNIQWLGDIPEHWSVERAKYLFQTVDIRSESGNEELLTVSAQHGIVPRKSAKVTMFKAESYAGYKLCWPGDLVINSLWAWAHALGISKYHGIVSSAYGVYRLLPQFNDCPQFIHYLVRSIPFQWELQVRSKGIWISRLQLTDEAFLGAPIPLPPLDEQHAIARYLDHITSRIDTYTSNKRKLVELLKEYRQALIHQTVTRGLDPNVKLKPSNIQWLGDVPQHWEVRRLRDVADMRVSNVDKHVREDEIPVRLCNYVDVYKNDYIDDTMAFMSATATPTEIERFRLERHDVLITKDSETWDDIGVPALVTQPAPDLVSGYHLALLRSRADKIKGDYLFRALQSTSLAYQFHIEAKGVTRYGLSQHGIKSVYLPLPPIDEQRAIADYLDRKTAKIDTAIDLAQREIELLEEYRTRLIADVVTGQLDIRDQNVPATPA